MTITIDMKGRRTLVTGAAGGLGRACARNLAEAGSSLALSDLSDGRLEQAVEEVTDLTSNVIGMPANLVNRANAQALVESARAHLGGLDCLVSCAGIMQTKPLADLSEADWRRMIDVNLTGVFFLTQAAGVAMRDDGGGSIVLLASVAARSGRALAAHYSASKTALLSLTKSAAESFAPTVRVNAVCPGLFLTSMWDGIMQDRSRLFGEEAGVAYRDQICGASLLQRHGEPGELASVVTFLASDLASYVTGQAVNVDGGLEMD